MVAICFETFLVNPGIFLSGGMDFIESDSWKVWFINLLINLPDMCGRFIYTLFPIWNRFLIYSNIFARLILLTILFLSASHFSIFKYDVIKIINILVFMFLHGYGTNALWAISYENIEKNELELVGKSMAFMLIGGIVLGAVVAALGLSKINF